MKSLQLSAHLSLSPLFTLVRQLCQTNAQYSQIVYQCHRTQHLAHYAKRCAYRRVRLHIDTSKAHTADRVCAVFIVLDRTAGSLMWVATETETGETNLAQRMRAACMPNSWPELKNLPEVIVWKQPATLSLSPLALGLSNVDDLDSSNLLFRAPVPGAPRWRSSPLPEDECGMEAIL